MSPTLRTTIADRARIAPEDRLTTNDLRGIVDGISGDKRLKMIPGYSWSYEATYDAIVYNHATALAQHRHVATGTIYRNVGYALHSKAAKSPWDYVGRTVRNVDRTVGKDLIAPRSVMSLIRAMEEERIETVQRREYKALRDNALPLRHEGYRQLSWTLDRIKLAAALPIGRMADEIGIPDYWLRAGIALKGVAAGALDPTSLPPDMPWDAGLCRAIADLKDKTTIDDMMAGLTAIVPKLVAARVVAAEPPPPPEPEPQPGDGDPQSGDEPNSEKNEPKCGKDKPQPGAGKKRQPKAEPGMTPGRQEMEKETRRTPTADETKDPDFLTGAGSDAGQTSEQAAKEAMGSGGFADPQRDACEQRKHAPRISPAWNGVLSTADAVIGPIRKAVRRHFVENEIGDLDRGLTSGDLDIAALIDATMAHEHREDVYQSRTLPARRSWRVYVLNDVSASMSYGVKGAPLDPTVFGVKAANERWMLASRLTVAIAHVLENFEGVDVAVGVHDDKARTIKSFGQRLSPEIKEAVMEGIGPFGATQAGTGYREALRAFGRGNAERNLLLHLTDGEFQDTDIRTTFDALRNAGIQPIVLTVGIKPDEARLHVGAENADEVDDATLGPTLHKHLRRFIGKGKSASAA